MMWFGIFINEECSIMVIEHMLFYVRIVLTNSTVFSNCQFLPYEIVTPMTILHNQSVPKNGNKAYVDLS